MKKVEVFLLHRSSTMPLSTGTCVVCMVRIGTARPLSDWYGRES